MDPQPQLDLKAFVREIPDFPKPGILFRDITPLLANPEAFRETVRRLMEPYQLYRVDLIAAAEARGFLFAAPMAMELGVGLVPLRKPGKLPYETHSYEYDLEYGTNRLEVHIDGMQPGQRVLLVDDLLATGGTMEASCRLIRRTGAEVVGCAFVIELAALCGAERLRPYPVTSVLRYD